MWKFSSISYSKHWTFYTHLYIFTVPWNDKNHKNPLKNVQFIAWFKHFTFANYAYKFHSILFQKVKMLRKYRSPVILFPYSADWKIIIARNKFYYVSFSVLLHNFNKVTFYVICFVVLMRDIIIKYHNDFCF